MPCGNKGNQTEENVFGADFWHLRLNGNSCLLSASHSKEIMHVEIDKMVGSIISKCDLCQNRSGNVNN